MSAEQAVTAQLAERTQRLASRVARTAAAQEAAQGICTIAEQAGMCGISRTQLVRLLNKHKIHCPNGMVDRVAYRQLAEALRARPKPAPAPAMPRFLTIEQIIRHANPYRENPTGVYFLIRLRCLMYVGQAINVHARVASHCVQGKIPFDSWHYIRCEPDQLNQIERRYLNTYLPPYNQDVVTASLRRRLEWRREK